MRALRCRDSDERIQQVLATDKRLALREVLAGERCIHPGSVFDPLSARIAEDIGFEAGMLAGSTASLTVLGNPDLIVLTLTEFAPWGVVGSITPTTNPTSTIINNSIAALSAGNAIAFNVHPSARQVSIDTIRVLDDALVSAGCPPKRR